MSLYSIGLIAFVIIAQLAPSFFIGLFWNRGSSKGAIIGIFSGLLITFFTLLVPFLLEANSLHPAFLKEGLFSIPAFKPHALLGIDFLTPPTHAFFWSFSVNTFCYVYFSLSSKGNYRERNYAEMFVDSKNFTDLQDSAFVWKGEAYVSDIKEVLMRFLGQEKATRALNIFFAKYNLPKNTQFADAKLIHFSEQLLTGSIGSASSKILIQSVVKEEEISLVEVLRILEESKEAIAKSKAFKEKSLELSNLANQLKEANLKLVEKDKQKDEFLDTVAHELKTPLTGIRATTELLLDDAEMPTQMKEQFLNNMLQDSERLSRLIHTILDFEKLSSEHHQLIKTTNDISKTIAKSIASLQTMAAKKNCTILQKSTYSVTINYDEDRMIQVFTNLIANAIKFVEPNEGLISIEYLFEDKQLKISVTDNGKGITEQDQEFIFDKFFQSKNQNTIKPIGTGLGLAICKQIIDKHQGTIWLDNSYTNGAKFHIKMPLN
jgi:signal transduction histidine kinase